MCCAASTVGWFLVSTRETKSSWKLNKQQQKLGYKYRCGHPLVCVLYSEFPLASPPCRRGGSQVHSEIRQGGVQITGKYSGFGELIAHLLDVKIVACISSERMYYDRTTKKQKPLIDVSIMLLQAAGILSALPLCDVKELVSEDALSIGVTLIRCFLKPAHRLLDVLSNSLTICVHDAEVCLCIIISLIRCFAKPTHRLLVILSNSYAWYMAPRLFGASICP